MSVNDKKRWLVWCKIQFLISVFINAPIWFPVSKDVCVCACGRCVYAHREVKTRSPWILEKHELPLSKPVNNSERCSMGKWEQEGFSCLSWSGLEAHGCAGQRKTKQSMSALYCVPVCHNHPWTLTRLFDLRRVEPGLNILMPSSVLFV